MANPVRRRDFLATVGVAGGIGLAGCTGAVDSADEEETADDDNGAADDGDGSVSGTPNAGVTLEDDVAAPTDVIELAGLDDEFGAEPFGVVSARGDEDETGIPVVIDRLADDRARFVVPPHPGEPMDGGAVELVVISEDGETQTEPLAFDIESLDPAPGTAMELFDTLEERFVARADTYGYTPEELLEADPSSFSPRLRPIAVGLHLFHDESSVVGPREIFEGEADIADEFQGVDEGTAVVDALLARWDIVSLVDDGVADGVVDARDATVAHGSAGGRVFAGPSNELPHDPSDLNDPTVMDRVVREQHRCHELLESPDLDLADLTVGLAGFVAPQPAGAAGVALAATRIDLTACAGWYPASIDIDATAEEPELLEDAPTDDPADRPEIEVDLIGWSQGFTIGVDDVIDFLPWGRALNRLHRAQRRAQPEQIEKMLHNLAGYFETVVSATVGFPEDQNGYQVDEQQWGPVAVDLEDDEDYVVWDLTTRRAETDDDPVAFDPETHTYWQEAVGEAELLVQSVPDAFADVHESDVEPIAVVPLKIEIVHQDEGLPAVERFPPYRLEAGELIQLQANIDHAQGMCQEWLTGGDPCVEWQTEPPGLGELSVTPDGIAATYRAPEEEKLEEVDVIELTARSLTETGAREGRLPERLDTARITFGDGLVVSPIPACLAPGTDHRFTAIAQGEELSFEDVAVTSHTGPGTIGDDGVFRAGTGGDVALAFEYVGEQGQTFTDEIAFEVDAWCQDATLDFPSTFDYVHDGDAGDATLRYPHPDEPLELPKTCAGYFISKHPSRGHFPGEWNLHLFIGNTGRWNVQSRLEITVALPEEYVEPLPEGHRYSSAYPETEYAALSDLGLGDWERAFERWRFKLTHYVQLIGPPDVNERHPFNPVAQPRMPSGVPSPPPLVLQRREREYRGDQVGFLSGHYEGLTVYDPTLTTVWSGVSGSFRGMLPRSHFNLDGPYGDYSCDDFFYDPPPWE